MLNKRAKHGGFTLLEMVIALAIFAVIMVIVMGGLNMVMRAQEQVTVTAKRLGEVQMAAAVLARDLTQLVPRAVRNYNGDLLPPVVVEPTNQVRLEFTCGGLVNPNALYQRSSLQRVGYGLDQGTLIRFSWPVLDRVATTEMSRRHLLSDVAGFDVQYLNTRGEFVKTAEEAIALLIDVDFGKQGHYSRTFALHGEVVNAPQS